MTESNIFFTSDLHLGHESILRYTDRGLYFDNIADHDEWIVNRINEYVSEKSVLYILGDVSMHNKWKSAELIERLQCNNKHLIFGNHDDGKREFYAKSELFVSVQDRLIIKAYSKNIVMDHFPLAEWPSGHHGFWHLHGHTHGSFDLVKRGLDRN